MNSSVTTLDYCAPADGCSLGNMEREVRGGAQ